MDLDVVPEEPQVERSGAGAIEGAAGVRKRTGRAHVVVSTIEADGLTPASTVIPAEDLDLAGASWGRGRRWPLGNVTGETGDLSPSDRHLSPRKLGFVTTETR